MNEQGLLGVNLETNDCSMKDGRREPRADRRYPCSALPAELFHAAEQSSARLGHAGICRLAARHHGPTALFDIGRLLPGVGLFHRRHVRRGVGAALDLIDADRRDCGNHGAACRIVRERLRRASEHPPAPAEADGECRGDPDGGALQEPLQRVALIPSYVLHEPLLPIGGGKIPPLSEYWATHPSGAVAETRSSL